jgi:hypothetical protein
LKLGSKMMLCQSKTQSVVAQSSAESELLSMHYGYIEAALLRTLMEELLGYAPIIRMHTDSSAARAIGLKSGLCGLKHIDIKVFLLQQEVTAGRLIICKVDGKKNSADLLTKEVDGATLSRLIGFLGVCSDAESIDACEEGWQVVQHRRGNGKKVAFSSRAASLRAITMAGMMKKATAHNPLNDDESWSWQWHIFVALMIILASFVISVLVGTGAPQRALVRDDDEYEDQDEPQQSWQEFIAEGRREEDAWHRSGDGTEWAEYMGMDASQHEPVVPPDGSYDDEYIEEVRPDNDEESELSDTPDHEAINEWIDRVVRHGQEIDERYHAEVVEAAITLQLLN